MNLKTFTNPILSGSFPDPSICCVGNDFYMVHSTFEYFPGIPLMHSKDLVSWNQIGNILNRRSQLELKGMRSSGGIYAVTIRHHNGTFYAITTLVDGGGNFYVSTKDPFGEWSDPVWIDEEGIDPSLFFDDDGKVYYTRHVGGGDGYIGQAEIDLATGKLKSKLQNVWAGTGGQWAEGPHLYKINDYYYLLIAEGGTSFDHEITIARSKHPMGPFESNPKNPILTHSHLKDHPFQSIGHADFIETPDGWWTVFLGVRKDSNHLGRETFLAPLKFSENHWPIINSNQPIDKVMNAPIINNNTDYVRPLEYKANFKSQHLGPEWLYIRNPIYENYSLTERPGFLRLRGSKVTLSDCDSPTFVGHRQTAAECTIATTLSFTPKNLNEEAGISIRANEVNHLDIGITKLENNYQVFYRAIQNEKIINKVTFEISNTEPIELLIEAEPSSYKFYFRESNSEKIYLGSSPTKHFVYESIGTFMGVVVGLYASGNGKQSTVPADFNSFICYIKNR